MKGIIAFGLFLILFFTLGCISSEEGGFTNEGYSAKAFIKDNSLILRFTSAKNGGHIKYVELYKEIDDVESEYITDCNLNNKNVEVNKDIILSCKPNEKGKYYLKIQIEHFKGNDYKPTNGETCLKHSGGWDCEFGGTIYFNVE